MFKLYRSTQIKELEPWKDGYCMIGISISEADIKNGSPKIGDMIARNPINHNDK